MAEAEEKYQLQMVSIFLQSHIKFNISLGKQKTALGKMVQFPSEQGWNINLSMNGDQ